MGQAVIGALRVDLSLGTSGWQKGVDTVRKQAESLGATIKKIGNGVTAAGKALSVGLTAPFVALMSQAIPAARESAQALGQVEAALHSMGPAAGRTKEQLQAAATELMHLSTFDDDEILQRVTANMLTFGNISGQVFDRAQRAAVDLATRMGTDLQSATLMIGKALNDPAKGLAALRRVGIQFTAQQQKQIQAMAKGGHTAAAQAVMLKELERQFGGSAKAMRDATPGADLKNSWDDFQETVGAIAINVLPKLTTVLSAVLEKFNALPPSMQGTAVAAAAIGAALGPVLLVLGPIISGIGALIPLIAGLGVSIGTAAVAAGGFIPLIVGLLPIIAGIAAAVGAAYLVWKNWATIGPMLQGFGQAVAAALGPSVINLFNALKEAALALWNSAFGQHLREAVAAVLRFASIVATSFGAAVPGILRALAAAFKGVFDMLAATIRFVVALLSGDWQGAWNAAKDFVRAFAEGVGGVLGNLTQAAIAFVSSMVRGIEEWIGARLEAVWNRVKAGVDRVIGFFRGMWDAVVGHSYVPDMVDGIAAEMGRLDREMVGPVKASTEHATKAMKKMAEESYKAAQKSFQAMKKMRDDMKALLDRLFPEAAGWAQYQKELAFITEHHKQLGLSAEQAAEAIRRLKREGLDETPSTVSTNVTEAESPWANWSKPDTAAKDPWEEYKRWAEEFSQKAMPDLSMSSRDHTALVIKYFAEMAQNVVGSLKEMVGAFKSGDIWDKITSVLGVVQQIVGAVQGMNGGKGAGGALAFLGGANTGYAMSYGGGRALGGPVVPGKAYRVGERGPEWFTPTGPGRVHPSGTSPARAGNTYNVQGNLLTPEFWAEIQHRDDLAAFRGSAGGMTATLGYLDKKAGRQLGGRRR